MGYYSKVGGSLVFDTPLNDDELKALQDEHEDSYLRAFFDITAKGLEDVADCEKYKAYLLEEEIQSIVNKHPGKGVIQVEGERSGDIWRLVIDGSHVENEDIQMTWRDGSLYEKIGD